MIKTIMQESPKFFGWLLSLGFVDLILVIVAAVLFLYILPYTILGRQTLFSRIISHISSKRSSNKKFEFLRSEAYREMLTKAIQRAVSQSYSITERYSYEVKQERDATLRNQMNYAEVELVSIMSYLEKGCEVAVANKLRTWHPCTCASHDMEKVCGYGKSIGVVQNDLYKKALSEVNDKLRDVIRRACKENGFDNMSDSAFTEYKKLRITECVNTIESTSESKVREYGMVVTHDDIWSNSDTTRMKEKIEGIFDQAKLYSINTKKNVTIINEKASKELANVSIEEQVQIVSFTSNKKTT